MVHQSPCVTAGLLDCVIDTPHHDSVTITIIISFILTLSTGSLQYTRTDGQWRWLDRIMDGSFLHLSSYDFVGGIFRDLLKEIYICCLCSAPNPFKWFSFTSPSSQVTWLRIYSLVLPSEQPITAHSARKHVNLWSKILFSRMVGALGASSRHRINVIIYWKMFTFSVQTGGAPELLDYHTPHILRRSLQWASIVDKVPYSNSPAKHKCGQYLCAHFPRRVAR